MALGISKKVGFKEESLLLLFFISLLVSTTTASIILIGHNESLAFGDIEANFAPSVKGSGELGNLILAEPLDACSRLSSKSGPVEGLNSPFVLIIRGGCTFEDKVRRAQSAGYKAAIIYDNEDNDALVAMAGSSKGIKIHAVFVSKGSGKLLKNYAGFTDMELWIIPNFESSAWSIMAISFVSLLAISAVLASCFFVRRNRIRQERPRAPRVRGFHGMSSRLVNAMPSLIFTAVLEDNCTSRTCAICLEDYSVGEKLRVLPCRHKFHALCVDSWLTTWRTFCPVCKRDAKTSNGDPPASECTPLLPSGQASPSSSAGLSSLGASSSSAIQIAPTSSRSPSVSRGRSLSGTSFVHPQSRRSYNNSPVLSLSRSSMDLRDASFSQTALASQLLPSYSGYPSLSSLNSRHILPSYVPSSSNASPSYVGSSSRQQSYLLHCSESTASLSPFDSTQSLPGC